MSTRVLQVGEWRFDPVDGSLSRSGTERRLDPRVVALLLVLIEREGELVDKDALMKSVWGDTTVADEAVTVAVYELRKALGDDARHPRYVETVPKRGYRLIAKVAPFGAVTGDTRLSSAKGTRVPWKWAVPAIVLGAALWWSRTPSDPGPTVIAVLPFENHSAGDEAYLASGVTDTLTTDLTRVAGVSVLAHHSARKLESPVDPRLEELGVSHVITGSVIRQGDKIRVNIYLSRRGDVTYQWSETYEGLLSSMLRLQRQAAVSIATQLSHEIQVDASPPRHEIPSEAMRAYLLGRFFWNERDAASLKKSIRFYLEALEAEPAFARAWAGLADAYTFPGPSQLGLSREEGYRSALDASRRAKELEPELAEAYVSSGAIRFVYEWNLPVAQRDFERALALAPSLALAHQWYAELLSARGDHDKSLAHMHEAARLDPHSVTILFDLVWVQYMAGDYTDAVHTLESTIRLAARGGDAAPTLFWFKGLVEARLDRMDDAVRSLALFYEAAGTTVPAEAKTFMSDPSREAFRDFRIKALEKEVEGGQSYALSLASAYADAGRIEMALDFLERAADEKDGAILWIAVSPDLANLRGERRFVDLVTKMGLHGETG